MGGWCQWVRTKLPVLTKGIGKAFRGAVLLFLHKSMEFHPVLVSFAAQT